MKQEVYIGAERKVVNISIGCKIGHSPYIISINDNPHGKKDIIDIFFASTLESAVREVVTYPEFKERGEICLITGDGQVCRITKDVPV